MQIELVTVQGWLFFPIFFTVESVIKRLELIFFSFVPEHVLYLCITASGAPVIFDMFSILSLSLYFTLI